MLRTVQLAGAIAVAAILSMSVLAACGGDDDSGSQATQAQSSSAQAIDEIDETSAGLDQALAQLRDKQLLKQGKHREYYFEATEILRGYLAQRYAINALDLTTAELMEKLEEGISTDLRGDIGKASANEISAHVKQLKADLATAKSKLEG